MHKQESIILDNATYPWDPYSDQPVAIRDRRLRQYLYRQGAVGTIKTFFAGLLLPLLSFPLLFKKRCIFNASRINSIGLCVNRCLSSKLSELFMLQVVAFVAQRGSLWVG